MVCKALGVTLPGASNSMNPNQYIKLARKILSGTCPCSGGEMQTIYMSNLISGPTKLGLNFERLDGQNNIIQASQSGK